MFRRAIKPRLIARLGGNVLLIVVAATAPSAAAADWQPQLVPPPAGYYRPDDAIRMQLPPLRLEVLQRLTLELNDIDVTDFVTSDRQTAVFKSPQPLAFGEHQLRLVENGADGSIIERASWTISVRKTAAFREAGLQAATTLTAARRVLDDDLPQPAPKRDQWNGGAQLQGALADGNWRFAGQADLLGNSEKAVMPRGVDHGRLDVGNFLFAYEHGPVVARAGHHAVGPDSLILSNFARRGVSVGMQSDVTAATVFSLRTNEVVGFHEGLGVGDSDNRTNGVAVALRPVGNERDALVVGATYLQGESADLSGSAGSGVAGDSTATKGRATSVVADGTLLDQRLRLRGEYARSRYDFDGAGRDTDLDGSIDFDMAPEGDRAYSALVTYSPWHDKVVAGEPLGLRLGLENTRIGTFFRSPGNPAGVSDRDLIRGFTGVNWSGIDAQLSIGRETDNVDDLALIPRTETLQNVLALTYTPRPPAPRADGTVTQPWYGQPVLAANVIDVDQDVTKAGAGLDVGQLNALRTYALNASFTYPTWSWTIGRTIGKTESFAGIAPDTETHASQISADWRIGERLRVTPTYQRSITDEFDPPAGFTERRLRTAAAGLSLGYVFADGINGTLGYNINRTDTSDDAQHTRARDLLLNLAWTAIPARERRAGLTFALDGIYHNVDDRVDASNGVDHYQIYLKAIVSWLPSW
jgi:hypothetical protein